MAITPKLPWQRTKEVQLSPEFTDPVEQSYWDVHGRIPPLQGRFEEGVSRSEVEAKIELLQHQLDFGGDAGTDSQLIEEISYLQGRTVEIKD